MSCPALRTSLREVFAEWSPEWTRVAPGEAPLDRVLVRLARRLDGVIDGVPPELGPEAQDGCDPEVEVRLAQAVRRDLLEQWRRGVLPADEERVLALMYAVEVHLEGLLTGDSEDLEAQLAGPDAFRLVTEVAHDLRSPLTSILFLSEALRNGHSGSLSELQQRQLGLVYAAALGLVGVVNDLMTVAQEQAFSVQDEAVAFSLEQTLEAVGEMVAPMAEAKQIDLKFGVYCFDHRFGPASALARVLLNLTTNAIKFTREGGLVEVRADSVTRDAVEISVRDTGRGIDPEQRAQLFQPFQKSHGRQGFFFAASGLGLSIVQRLLAKAGAELSVESEVGRGTTFSFVMNLPSPH